MDMMGICGDDCACCPRYIATKEGGWCESYPCDRINRVFETSEKLRSHAGRVCSPAEMEMLAKAFLTKKEYFDRVHENVALNSARREK